MGWERYLLKVQNHYHNSGETLKSRLKNKKSSQENYPLTGFLEILSILRISLFILIWEENMGIPKAADDAAELSWFALDDLPDLAFDHDVVIRDVIQLMRK